MLGYLKSYYVESNNNQLLKKDLTMNKLISTILLMTLFSCAHSPNSEHMKQFVFMKEVTDKGGIIEYADITSSYFKVQPKTIARNKMKSKCPNGYKITKTSTSLRTRNFGRLAKENTWKTEYFICKK